MPLPVSNYLGGLILARYLTNGSVWLALHSGDPTPTNDPSTEFRGGGYARQSIRFGDPSGKAVVSITGQTFSGLIADTVVVLGIHTSKVGGNLLVPIDISDNPMLVPGSGLLDVPAGDVAVQL